MPVFDLQPFSAGDLKPARIEPEQVKNGGVDVGDVMPVFYGMEPELIGCAMDDAASDAATGHPDREPIVMVIAAVGAPRTECGRTRWPI